MSSSHASGVFAAILISAALLALLTYWTFQTFRPHNTRFYKILWSSDVPTALKSDQYERIKSNQRCFDGRLCKECARIPFDQLFAMTTSTSGKRRFYRVGRPMSNVLRGRDYGRLEGLCTFCSLVSDSLRKLGLLEGMRREGIPWKLWYHAWPYTTTIMTMVVVEPGLVDMYFTPLSVESFSFGKQPAWDEREYWNDGPQQTSGAFLIQRATGDTVTPETSEDLHGTTRLADSLLIRRWIDCCLEQHRPICESQEWDGAMQKPDQVRVIDLQQSCIVSLPSGSAFVALSYVWGASKSLELRHDNAKELERMGGLTKHIKALPLTISDAMSLCERVGQRYLWVDKLCIVQDDVAHAAGQVAQMDAIYGSATFTIVAADGVDANAGLAGIRPNSRAVVFDISRSPHLFRADIQSDMSLIGPLCRISARDRREASSFEVHVEVPVPFPPVEEPNPNSAFHRALPQATNPLAATGSLETPTINIYDVDNTLEISFPENNTNFLLSHIQPAALPFTTRHLQPPTSIYDTPWFSRAWTFQEWVLSKRLLISTDNQLFWHCKRSTWCEDMLQRKVNGTGFCIDPNYPPIQRLNLKAEHLRRDTQHGDQDGAVETRSNGTTIVIRPRSFMAYNWAVQNYSNRKLSYDDDVLTAFQGISRILALCLDCEMFWGLPEALFDSALLWEPVQQLRRRESKTPFPSWSWAGWIGKVRYRKTFGVSNKLPRELHEEESHEERIRCSVRWFRKAAGQNDFTVLNDTGLGIKSISNESSEELPPGWRQVPTKPSPGFWKRNTIDTSDHTLQFWATSVTFTVSPLPAEKLGTSSLRIKKTQRSAPQPIQCDIFNKTSTWIGSGFFDAESPKMNMDVEMIAISETQFFADVNHNVLHDLYSKRHAFELYNVMLIRYNADGTASRIGLGRVFQSQFDHADPEMKWIVLG